MVSHNLPAYRAIATNPVPVAVGGATLALVLLGLRTLFGAMIGRDSVITHVTGRLIPAVAACGDYTVLLTWSVDHINMVGAAIGPAAFGGLLSFPSAPNPALILPYAVLWLLLILRRGNQPDRLRAPRGVRWRLYVSDMPLTAARRF